MCQIGQLFIIQKWIFKKNEFQRKWSFQKNGLLVHSSKNVYFPNYYILKKCIFPKMYI